jgi:predicted nucleic acid-binding Zn ribbon protein
MRDGGPRKLGDYVKVFLKKAGLDSVRKVQSLPKAWAQAVEDPKTVPHTRPGTVRSGILKVEVDSPVIMQGLLFRRRDIVRRLSEFAPELGVKDIRIVVGEHPR